MINQVVRLTYPKRFEVTHVDTEYTRDDLIVRPTYMSICQADQRYYNGFRDKQTLEKKLPMSLIHESIGEVVYDPKKEFKLGERVALIPNFPGYVFGKAKSKSVLDKKIGENYCRDGKFRSSGYDGFMQELIIQPRDLVVKIPNFLPDEIAAFTELITISTHAIRRFELFSNQYRERFGIWGDGNVGFLTALLLKNKYPNSHITVYGKYVDKLKLFTFVDEVCLIEDIDNKHMVDHVFECVGGRGSKDAINQAIDIISPGGTVTLLGVSEDLTDINTRLILEKGLILLGNSRSAKVDFVKTIDTFQDGIIHDYLNILISNVVKVNNINDIISAFEKDKNKIYGKTILKWEF
ncbi:alcohol dehydrogenase catalytic domain-containing protein [Priestia megaterium]|uniref:alcohol dehydrogenase catalytic domain-containing protein n=1 Tax=Priestia megaterium TaxID=1404 RepID=UPI0030C8F127